MKPRLIIFAGGLLLMVGFALPWITIANTDGTWWAIATGLHIAYSHHPSIYSLLGGLVLVLIGIFGNGRPGKSFSIFGVMVSILCGLLLTSVIWFYSDILEGNESFSYGLTVISPLGVLLGLIGSLVKVPIERSPDLAMVT